MTKTFGLGIGALFLVLAAAGCETTVDRYCETTADCDKDPRYTFCDVDGVHPASEGIGRTCIPNPFDAGLPDAGLLSDAGSLCEPSSQTCDGDDLVVCDEAGQSVQRETCVLGCLASEGRCSKLVPSNDLGVYLELAASAEPVDLPSGVVIDTTAGTITDADGTVIEMQSALVEGEDGGSDIRVFWASSLALGDMEITGWPALAFVASGSVDVAGSITVTAGRYPCGSAPLVCDEDGSGCAGGVGGAFGASSGGGGTGGAEAGTDGLPRNGTDDLEPLRGGCDGKTSRAPLGAGTVGSYGGAAGGALQITSGEAITVGLDTAPAAVLANGGGGQRKALLATDPLTAGGGGGSGGGILLEAPVVSVSSYASLLANGGGGACAKVSGGDAGPNGTAASGGVCAEGGNGGRGGTASNPAGPGLDDDQLGGGGGGSVGRIRINTKSGTFSSPGKISPEPSVGGLAIE